MVNEIKKLGIANRGEVAVRIIHACREMGIQSVLLHSEADTQTLAYRMADECICIGPANANESYLNIENNISGAKSAGVDAIHPGFGFLSENSHFAQACEDHRIIFVGPSVESLLLFADKVSAKTLVKQAGVPTIPGYEGDDQSEDRLLKELQSIGYPAMVKAAAGGGGRGLRIVSSEKDAVAAIEGAKREGLNAFGSDKVFIERYLGNAKHIEVQIFVDSSGEVFHLFERECSVQRRHQKIIEESPSPALDPSLRRKICASAVKIAEAASYKGAGTIEFLLEGEEYFFLEMNTRLQVEHPVTELVVGVDLVKAQLLTAQDKSLIWERDELNTRGHAIECRIYAEDPFEGGVPSTGELGRMEFPNGPGRRFEVGFQEGDELTSLYDPMFAKVIVWDENRPRAIQKMRQTLRETIIFGVKTNIPFLLEILSHHEFVDGTMTTQFINQHYPQGLLGREMAEEVRELGRSLFKNVGEAGVAVSGSGLEHPNPFMSIEAGGR